MLKVNFSYILPFPMSLIKAFLRLFGGFREKITFQWRNCPHCGKYGELIVFIKKNHKGEYVTTRILAHGNSYVKKSHKN